MMQESTTRLRNSENMAQIGGLSGNLVKYNSFNAYINATIYGIRASKGLHTGAEVAGFLKVEDKGDIISGCKSGRRSDQQRLYEWLAPCMLSVCQAYARDRSEAEDFLHEGFLRVFKGIGQYRGEGSFEGWVRRIMVNVVLERYRRHHWLYPVEDIQEIPTLSWQMPDVSLETNEILSLIAELPPRYRMVFNLYALEGHSHKEIAQMMDISEGTSKSNLSRARQILQDKLAHDYGNRQKHQNGHETNG